MKTKKILIVCALAFTVAGVSLIATSCMNSHALANSKKSSQVVSKVNKTVEIDLKSAQDFAYKYYCENLDSKTNKAQDYQGKITKENAESILRCAIDKNQSGINLDKYAKSSGNEQFSYVIPEDIGDKIIKSCFNAEKIDHSLFSSYNAKTKQYVIGGGDFASSTDYFAATEIKNLNQSGDKITATANFYKIKSVSGDQITPDYSEKYQTLQFTFKISNGKYIYQAVKSI